MRKKDLLAHWRKLPENLPLKPAVVPYVHEGSTFAQDGVRITGSQAFIDAVLSRLARRWAADDRIAVLVDSLTVKLVRA